jgi:hypothetical protein
VLAAGLLPTDHPFDPRKRMKLRALIPLIAVALVATSVAAAATHGRPPRHGKVKVAPQNQQAPARGQACRGRQLMLGGLYVSGSADSDGTGSFVLDVKRMSRLGKRLGLDGNVTVNVDARTKFRRGGRATLADLQANDRLGVLARVCKPAAGSDAPVILARQVVAHAPAATLAAAAKP